MYAVVIRTEHNPAPYRVFAVQSPNIGAIESGIRKIKWFKDARISEDQIITVERRGKFGTGEWVLYEKYFMHIVPLMEMF